MELPPDSGPDWGTCIRSAKIKLKLLLPPSSQAGGDQIPILVAMHGREGLDAADSKGAREGVCPAHASTAVHFDHYILDDIRRCCASKLVDELILHVANHDAAVNSAVLAVGAMCRAVHDYCLEIARSLQMRNQLRHDGPAVVVYCTKNLHHQAALTHYDKAISLCRHHLSASSLSLASASLLQTVMTANLLFVMLEMLQGDFMAASNLIARAQMLLEGESQRAHVMADEGLQTLWQTLTELLTRCA
jgi:hypothetical protein